MKMFVLTSAAVTAFLAGTACGQTAVRSSVAATDQGMIRLNETRQVKAVRPILGGTDAILWTWQEPLGIPESCGLSPFANSAWVGEAVNNERVQRFEINGGGTPTGEFFGTHITFNPAGVAAAQNADLAVFLNQTAFDGPFVFYAFRSTDLTTPLWQFNVPTNYIDANVHAIRVSRDGGVVALGVYDPALQSGRAYFFNGNTGAEINHWDGPFIGGIDLTDDGSLALLAAGSDAKLINTAAATEAFSAGGSGSGGWYNISGNGDVLVVGGFSFQVYKKTAGVYTSIINFNAPTSWFSWGSAVSRDGSTVAALSHDYGSGYLNTSVRIWDVATTTLLGTVNTVGTGGLQDSAVYGVLSDDGQVFACASWGAEDNNHPEVRVFNRDVELIASIDTPGSPFSLDLSGDGRYVLAGSKSGHANAFGNGGHVNLLELEVPSTCYANCDGSTASPVLTGNDFVCFVNAYANGESYANCDGTGGLTANDFVCFINEYAEGCS